MHGTYQAYDAAGHTAAYGGLSFTYNGAGRLFTAVNGSATSSYIYNALGQRVQKATAAGITAFVYDESGHLLGEYDGTGNAIEEIIWLGDTPIATVRQEACGLSIFYIHTDHLNTPRRITRRSTSDVVWSWDSDPFGAAGPNENPSGLGSFSFNLRFPGQYYDAETGLSYNAWRDYDPGTGRYVESDPIGLAGGSYSTYAYASGNPISRRDPYGLFDPTGWVGPAIGTVEAATGAAAAAVGFAVVAIVFPTPAGDPNRGDEAHPPQSDPALQQEIERQANAREYHRRCNEPPPPGLDPCERAKWMLKKAQECKAMRIENTNRWWGGVDNRHDPQLFQDLNNAIKNAQDAVDRLCNKCK